MAFNSRERIPQTHRAILFESFTDSEDVESPDLYTFLNRFVNDRDKDKQALFNSLQDLEVRSFNEFLEKFSPRIYEYTEKIGDKFVFKYTTQKSRAPANAPTVKLADHGYFKMLCALYNQKEKRGLPNLEFEDSDILARLLPQHEIEEIYDDRKLLYQLAQDHEAKIANNEIPHKEAEQLVNFRQKIIGKYSSSPLPLLSIALADAQYKLEKVEESIKELGMHTGGGSAGTVAIGTMSLDDDGRPVFKELPPAESAASREPDMRQKALAQEKLRQVLAIDFDDHAPDKEVVGIKKLIVDVYAPAPARNDNMPAEMNAEELDILRQDLQSRKDELQEIYTGSKNSFIETLSNIVRKLLCVKVFFDHATGSDNDDAKLEHAGLIVANCHPGKLVDPKVLDAFTSLMRHFGINESDNKIWFGILPHVQPESGKGDTAKITNGFGAIPKASDNALSKVDEYASLGDAIAILDIMNQAKITTFFNFASSGETGNTFEKLNADKINNFKRLLEPLNRNEHAVFVYPNFTLMDDRLIPMPGNRELIIQAPAVHIDAAYVAAGLQVASQQARILRSEFINSFLPENVNARIDFENNDISNKFLTRFNCELANNWDAELKEAINNDSFGFVFCGDVKYNSYLKGDNTRTYVYQARTMAKDKQGRYKPLFGTIATDFFNSFIHSFGGKSGSETRKRFLAIVQEWQQQGKGYPDGINLIMRPGDTFESDSDQKGLKVRFGDVGEFYEVEITQED